MVRTRKQRQTAPGTPEAAPQEEDAVPVADVDETKKKQRRRSSGLGSWLNTSTLATLAAAFYVVTAVRNFGRAARARDIGRRATARRVGRSKTRALDGTKRRVAAAGWLARPSSARGAAAAYSWIFRGDARGRIRSGRARVLAATSRACRGAAAAASWIFRGERSRRRRGYHVDSPWETRAVKRAVVARAGG